MSFCLYTLSPNVCALVYNNYSYSHLKFEISLMNLKTSGIRWSQPYQSPILSTDTLCREGERLVTTANCTSKTTNSNDIQQHVNSANSGDVDIRNLTITLMRTVVLQRSRYKMPGCSVQWKMNRNIHAVHPGYLSKFCELFCGHSSSSQEFATVSITLVEDDCHSITGPPN